MNRKRMTALLLSTVMAVTPAMPAMAEQQTVTAVYADDADATVTVKDPVALSEKKTGWETVKGVKYYYENGKKVTNKAKKIGKYMYCFDKNGKLVTNKPYYKVNSNTYYRGYFQKSKGKGAHAWVEIDQKAGGKTRTYVYDPNFQQEYGLNGYKLTYGAPKTLKYIDYKRVN